MSSSTYEEAPSELRGWLKQRTRWFKGWMRLASVFVFLFVYNWLDKSSGCQNGASQQHRNILAITRPFIRESRHLKFRLDPVPIRLGRNHDRIDLRAIAGYQRRQMKLRHCTTHQASAY
jgi:cellulose synthase/poly-beta-1,6-N-acetylglucosamine synthase-like glycosyltransferase